MIQAVECATVLRLKTQNNANDHLLIPLPRWSSAAPGTDSHNRRIGAIRTKPIWLLCRPILLILGTLVSGEAGGLDPRHRI